MKEVNKKEGKEKMKAMNVQITMTTSEYEVFKKAYDLLLAIYLVLNDDNIEMQAKTCADIMKAMMLMISVKNDNEA